MVGALLMMVFLSQARAGDVREVNPDKFEHFVHSRLKDRVQGYSFTLVAPGQTKAHGAGGYAQHPSDGNVPMTTSVYSNIGSVSKVITGVAFLHMLREHPIGSGTVNQQLDTEVRRFLPPRLRRQYQSKLRGLTFRHLLTHKSGLVQETNDRPDGWTNIEWALHKGSTNPGTGRRDYNNTNISLMRLFIPMIAYPNATAWQEAEHGYAAGRRAYFDAILPVYNNMYKNYMNRRFFKEIFSGQKPVCNPHDEIGSRSFTKSYPGRSRSNGYFPRPSACAPQGGFFFSARQFAQFAKVFGHTNKLVGNGIRKRMMRPDDIDDRLVFSKVLNDSVFEEQTGQSAWPFHGGTFKNYRAALIPLPDKHYAAAVINSPEFSSSQLTRILFDAFVYATVGFRAEHLSANDDHHFAYYPGIYVTAGNSQDFDRDKKFYVSSLDGTRKFEDVFDISANNNLHFAWFKRNQGLWAMRGNSSNMDSDRSLYPSKIDPVYTLDNLIHVSSNNDMHFAWYNDNGELWVSGGASNDLASKRRASKSKLATGKSISDLVAIVSSSRSHFAYYDNCTFSEGETRNLASIQVRRNFLCTDIER